MAHHHQPIRDVDQKDLSIWKKDGLLLPVARFHNGTDILERPAIGWTEEKQGSAYEGGTAGPKVLDLLYWGLTFPSL